MAGYFVFFRCWPGFREPFPFEDFNGLSDAELTTALDSFATEQVRTAAVRDRIKEVGKQRRRRFNSALKKQSFRRLGGGPSPGSEKKPRVSGRQMRWRRVRCADRKDPLVCRLGAYLGWWRSEIRDQTAPCRPRAWVCETPSREFAKQLVSELNRRSSLDYGKHRPEFHFNPHFGFASDEAMSDRERASIRRCIGRIQANEDPPVEYAKEAKLIGYRAFQVALELDAGWPKDDSDKPPDTPADLEPQKRSLSKSTPPKGRNVSEKTETRIGKAIQALPRGSTQESVAEKAQLALKTVGASKAWDRRWIIWDVQEPSSNRDDVDMHLDIQGFIKAKRGLLHHKTLAKVNRFMADADKQDQLIARLIPMAEALEAEGKSLPGLSDGDAREVIRVAAEQVSEKA